MNSGTVSKYQVQKWRVLFVYLTIVAVVGAILIRLVNLQVLSTESWMDQAVDNYTLTIRDAAPR